MSANTAVNNPDLVAACGLYCGACGAYLKGRCKGCKENVKASWCGVRTCCIQNVYKSCADCLQMPLKECKKFNNFISKIVGFILNSDRASCVARIKETGYEKFAAEMAESNSQSMKKRK